MAKCHKYNVRWPLGNRAHMLANEARVSPIVENQLDAFYKIIAFGRATN